jgi:hypothetical protein
VLEVTLLLRAAQAGPPLRLVLVAVVLALVRLGEFPSLLLVLFYPLCLALLLRGRLGFGLGCRRSSLCGLFPLYFRVFGSVPRVEDLL